ncbi:MAG TPA: ATP-binding protein [Croceibacterium sp.]|nr:ATP-binding protein [Croceibacterium sp.]
MESSRPPLSHSEARRDFFQKTYERIAELGKIGVWECDLATEALTWTDTVYDMFDLPRQSSVNRATVLQCYEPASRRKMERLRVEAIARCSTFTVDVEILTPRGNARWIRITGDVEQEAGRAVRIFGTKQDITLEKTAQQEVLALQTELIHLSRASAMDAMRSTLAHELNQPLAAIANYVSALRKLMDPRSADHRAAQDILDGVERSALKTGEIIRGVRDMTRGRRAQPVPFDLEAAVREAGTIALAGAPPGLEATFACDEGLEAMGDPVQVQQVVINLVRNARDALAGHDAGKILVSTSRIDGVAEVCVRDTGPGIAPHLMETLFDSFVTGKPGGTGLGLAICRTIVEAHSGRITAENASEGGALFRFTLPLAVARRESRPLEA